MFVSASVLTVASINFCALNSTLLLLSVIFDTVIFPAPAAKPILPIAVLDTDMSDIGMFVGDEFSAWKNSNILFSTALVPK